MLWGKGYLLNICDWFEWLMYSGNFVIRAFVFFFFFCWWFSTRIFINVQIFRLIVFEMAIILPFFRDIINFWNLNIFIIREMSYVLPHFANPCLQWLSNPYYSDTVFFFCKMKNLIKILCNKNANPNKLLGVIYLFFLISYTKFGIVFILCW